LKHATVLVCVLSLARQDSDLDLERPLGLLVCVPPLISLYTILRCTLCMVYGIETGGRRGVEYCVIALQ